MYLSRLSLEIVDRENQKVLSDGYRLHQMVMGGFKQYDSVELGRVLFRLEPETHGSIKHLLVQSRFLPDWSHLSSSVSVESKPYAPQFSEGSVLSFRLRANPVVTRDGKRRGLVREEAQTAWLCRKEIGVEWLDVAATDEGYFNAGKKGTHIIELKSVLFQGHLRVVDDTKFRNALAEGIGPAKGFGFGLLSIAGVR